MENDDDSNDWLDLVFADDFDTNSLSDNLTIEYDGAGGLVGLNGDQAPAFSSELRIEDDNESDYEEENNDGIPDAFELFASLNQSDDDDYKFIGVNFDEPLQDLTPIEVENLLNHFTIRSDGDALPASAFSRIETGDNDNDPNDWLDLVFADDFDTNSLSDNLTIEYDGAGGLVGLNGESAPAFSSELRIEDDNESDYEAGNNDGIPDATELFARLSQSNDDDYKFIGVDFDEPFQDLTPTEVENLLNHFTIRSDGDALPVSAFSRIEIGAMENDDDSNDWLDLVFADDFDTNSLSDNLTIEYDGAGGLVGLNGDQAPAFSSELRIEDDNESDYEEGNNDGIPDAFELFASLNQSDDDDYKFIGVNFDEPLQDLTPIEVENLLNHFTIRSDGDALPASAFSRIETGDNDNDPNDWLDIVFADDFDTNSLSDNLTIEYDGAGGLVGLNGESAPAFSSELRIEDDNESDYEEGNNDGIPDAFELFASLNQSDDDDYKFIGVNFDEPLQDLTPIEVENLLNHFTIRSDGDALPASAFSRIETGDNDNDPNDWLDIVFADDFDTNSLSDNLTIEYDGAGGLVGLNGEPAPAFSSELTIYDDTDGGEEGVFDKSGKDIVPPIFESLSLSTSSVDVSSSDQTVTFTARITDDLSGISNTSSSSGFAQVGLRSPSGEQSVWAWFSENNRISGDSTDGVYEIEITIPAFSEAGEWKVHSIETRDTVGNSDYQNVDNVMGIFQLICNLRLVF